MNMFIQKYFTQISIIFLAIFIVSFFFYPAIPGWVGFLYLLFYLSMAISSIFNKHKGSGNQRSKIVKDVLKLVITLILIIFLGGLAGLFANSYASLRFGAVAGFVSAIAVSLVMGYLVQKGMGRLIG